LSFVASNSESESVRTSRKDLPADLRDLHDQLDAAERDARALVAGCTEEEGTWHPQPGAWSIAECLDHLATGNRVYLAAMQPTAADARARGRWRSRPVKPGFIGQLFLRMFFEPPPASWSRLKAPRAIRPSGSGSLAETFAAFLASQSELRAFVVAHGDLDLTGIRFPNPFIRGVRFSIATGLYLLAAHERRHLWQAWQARRSFEGARIRRL
jgi:hypothetical protein